ncbi:MAG: cytochrome [Hydrocarboniphaga sp.]|uniref:cytochrome P450 n=1 Tax=Hydrocarboniphaga sp. TaxID=2033016 RepID=UPI0026245475|nr:cytochrome P450 [Hydrocarboniphaga sp.]MDB5968036.1 cytochrome [Hydrocarboniphaga sp.]
MTDFRFDPLDHDTAADPGKSYSELRARCPFYKYEGEQFQFWITSHYDEIKRDILTDNPIWSFKFGNAAKDTISEVGFKTDPPFHNAFRLSMQPGLSPKAVQRYEPEAVLIANELIDRMQQRSGGDFHDEFALPLPAQMMCVMLGTPRTDYLQYKHWADELQMQLFHDPTPGSFEKILTVILPHFSGLLAERRKLLDAAGVTEPTPAHLGTVLTDDYLSRVLVAKVEKRYLTEPEMLNVCLAFLTGGQETTTNLISNLLWRLLQVPERWQQLKANPQLIEVAVEESLRYDPPVLAHFRTSLCPVTMHGQELPERAKLMFNITGANRDPQKFPDGEAFRLDRPLAEAKQHLSFGSGVHFCLGAPIARMEAKVALKLLMERLPKLRLNGPTERIESWMHWGRTKLPLAWD